MQALTLLQKFFSVDMVIYAAIVLVAATALAASHRAAVRRRICIRRLQITTERNEEAMVRPAARQVNDSFLVCL